MFESFLIAWGFVLALSGLMWAYHPWIRPQVLLQWIDKTFAKFRACDSTPLYKQSDIGLSFDAAGITVAGKRPTSAPVHFIAWSDIVRVVAFKRDLFTVDCICLAFAPADGMTTEVNEEMEGWEALTDALPKYFPEGKDWRECFSKVAFPAFATNETVIYERRSEGSNCDAE